MPSYTTTTPPDEVTEELIQAILEDAAQHLEMRLAAIARDFDRRIQETREYMNRRTRERVKELTNTPELELRRKQRQRSPVIPDWRVRNGEFSPDDPRRTTG